MSDLSKDDIIEAIALAVAAAVETHPLSPEEVEWVRMAIKAEADKAAFRKAVIEKSLTGLLATVLGAVGIYFVDYFHSIWFK